ncbi:hypothetical protein [Achromobacter xylosoxidans]|uniref:hypothetical protein n=1 Tax=Alcaligenes xylosoxydans xylosoxydans TaxID=85698 RepID=UPI00105DC125|nr:hypothetical protein [Achromobacter xylosoxidans]
MATRNGSRLITPAISKLHFDLKNPRFSHLEDERDALNAFCSGLHAAKTVRLAESIAEFGLNPSKMLIVVPAEKVGHFVVHEGNRRLAALRLLALPKRAIDSPLSRPFVARIKKASALLHEKGLPKVPCVEFFSRDGSDYWVNLEHTGENDGIGVVGWDGEETARFRGSDPALQLLDFVRRYGELSARANEGLSRFSVTNLKRILGDPYARSQLGLVIKSGEIYTTHEVDAIMPALKRVIEDIATKEITVADIDHKSDRKKYIDNIGALLPKGQVLTSPQALADMNEDGGARPSTNFPEKKAQKERKSNPTSRERKSVIDRKCVITIDIPKINDVYDELKRLPAGDFSNAACGLLRTLIDTSTQEYVSRMKLQLRRNHDGHIELKPRIEAVLSDVATRIGDKEISATAKNTLLQPSGVINIDKLHFVVHGRHAHPDADQLKQGWNMIEPWIRNLWTILSDKVLNS